MVLLAVENRGSGTGFFINADGLLVTNAHVVGSREAKILALWDASARRQPVRMRVVQISEADDLALLKAESGAPFQTLEMAEVYELSRPLIAAGFPLAGGVAQALQTSPSDIVMSRGALSSLRRQGQRVEWIQHDCKVASGNSGGPLIDQATGAVIGINTLVFSAEANGGHGDSMSMSIPIRKVRERFAALIKP